MKKIIIPILICAFVFQSVPCYGKRYRPVYRNKKREIIVFDYVSSSDLVDPTDEVAYTPDKEEAVFNITNLTSSPMSSRTLNIMP